MASDVTVSADAIIGTGYDVYRIQARRGSERRAHAHGEQSRSACRSSATASSRPTSIRPV